jgi:lipid A 3-O-deacylase
MRAAALSCVLLTVFACPAAAADLLAASARSLPVAAPAEPFASGWELRLGASAHDISGPEEGSVGVRGEVLSPRLLPVADPVASLFVPRVHLGGSVNTAGDTSFAYAGLTWTFDITPRVFVEGSLGGAVHDGNTSRVMLVPHESALGCSPLFREAAAVGYRIDAHWSVMASIEHLSNAGLCSQNRGLTNVGLQLGYAF